MDRTQIPQLRKNVIHLKRKRAEHQLKARRCYQFLQTYEKDDPYIVRFVNISMHHKYNTVYITFKDTDCSQGLIIFEKD